MANVTSVELMKISLQNKIESRENASDEIVLPGEFSFRFRRQGLKMFS